ncbi:formate/nitrite transporter family protein [Jiella sp. MQZ9-1]|uniref:Formate/nitrite transporter family protein n=1 Tax=Jiella flava TaxID=2816857 RepID=A0A939FT23_9HYPH|nr:formate/nitrite transporter family protein [Jiella flava]MBO0661032.1 formate/nitrite transporter family protein [Jiella flava]MCD2469680.1 formate/nitrite transporter family protein [Jiella flava]
MDSQDRRRDDAHDDDPDTNSRRHSNDVTEKRLEHEGSTLTETELHEIERRLSLRPLAIYELVRQEGEDELTRPLASLWWSGLAAGLSIGFSVFTQAVLRAYLPDTPWRPLIECWGYSVGFLIVILGRQQLFTEITLTATLPVLARPKWIGVKAIIRLWAMVFIANMAGTAVFGAGIAFDALHTPEITDAALAIAREAMEAGPWTTLMRGMAAGWLIATVVWVLPSAQNAGFFVIALLTYLIALFHLSHIVAGSVEAMALMFAGELMPHQAIWSFYLPALAGNILGGSALFALISYGQVAPELDQRGN